MSKLWTKEEDQILSDTSLHYDTICKKLPHRSKRSIWTRSHRLGYNRDINVIRNINSNNQKKDVWTKLLSDKEFYEIINGELLGDGCIYRKKVKNRKCYEYSFIAGSIHKDYAEYVHKILSRKLKSKAQIKTVKPNLDKKSAINSVKDFYSYRFSSVVFKSFYDSWYPKGSTKTTVPTNLKLSPTTCLHWYLGDGSLDSRSDAKMFELSLHTENFELESVSKLWRDIEKLGIKCSVAKSSKKYYKIRIHGNHARKFLKYIGRSPVKSFEYKWRDWKEEV